MPATVSARRWIRALEPWACSTRRMMPESMVSAPTLVARIAKHARLIDSGRADDHSRSTTLLNGEAFPGEHRLIHCDDAPRQHDTVGRNFFTRPHEQLVSQRATWSMGRSNTVAAA